MGTSNLGYQDLACIQQATIGYNQLYQLQNISYAGVGVTIKSDGSLVWGQPDAPDKTDHSTPRRNQLLLLT